MVIPLDNSSASRLQRGGYSLAQFSQSAGSQISQEQQNYTASYQQPISYHYSQQPANSPTQLLNYSADSSDQCYKYEYSASKAPLVLAHEGDHLDQHRASNNLNEIPASVSDAGEVEDTTDVDGRCASSYINEMSGKGALFGTAVSTSPLPESTPPNEHCGRNSLGLTIDQDGTGTFSVANTQHQPSS
ncbi:hypothetical protein H4S07_007059, partial [Coemansia furcata]